MPRCHSATVREHARDNCDPSHSNRIRSEIVFLKSHNIWKHCTNFDTQIQNHHAERPERCHGVCGRCVRCMSETHTFSECCVPSSSKAEWTTQPMLGCSTPCIDVGKIFTPLRYLLVDHYGTTTRCNLQVSETNHAYPGATM